jgi:hypothetical protein
MHPKISAVDEAGAVRAENFRAWRLTEVSPGCTRLEYTCSLDLKGHFPKFITNTIIIPTQAQCSACALGAADMLGSWRFLVSRVQMRTVATTQLYFLKLLPCSQCTAQDGRDAGHQLMDLVETKPDDLAHAVRMFAIHMAMFRECALAHIGDMLAALTAIEPTRVEPGFVGVQRELAEVRT